MIPKVMKVLQMQSVVETRIRDGLLADVRILVKFCLGAGEGCQTFKVDR